MATGATSVLDSKLHKSPGKLGIAIFGGVLLIGISYTAVNLVSDLSGVHATSIMPYLLLTLALLVAWPQSTPLVPVFGESNWLAMPTPMIEPIMV